MTNLCMCWSSIVSFPTPLVNNFNHSFNIITSTRGTGRGVELERGRIGRQSEITVSATKSGGFASIINGCSTCKGQGAIECPGCKGTGRNKKNGNIFERWKCYDCQGFGLKSCPSCGKGGLTPEQRGER